MPADWSSALSLSHYHTLLPRVKGDYALRSVALTKGVLLKMLMSEDVAGRREVGQKRRTSQGSDDEDPLQPHELAQATANPRRLIALCPYEPRATKATDRFHQRSMTRADRISQERQEVIPVHGSQPQYEPHQKDLGEKGQPIGGRDKGLQRPTCNHALKTPATTRVNTQ